MIFHHFLTFYRPNDLFINWRDNQHKMTELISCTPKVNIFMWARPDQTSTPFKISLILFLLILLSLSFFLSSDKQVLHKELWPHRTSPARGLAANHWHRGSKEKPAGCEIIREEKRSTEEERGASSSDKNDRPKAQECCVKAQSLFCLDDKTGIVTLFCGVNIWRKSISQAQRERFNIFIRPCCFTVDRAPTSMYWSADQLRSRTESVVMEQQHNGSLSRTTGHVTLLDHVSNHTAAVLQPSTSEWCDGRVR